MAIWNPRANEIFASILELPVPQQQAALDQACAGNDDLRRQVDALLAAHLQAGSFLDRPVNPAEMETVAPDANGVDPLLGIVRYVGDYELLAELGRGGMGVVYKARQALKIWDADKGTEIPLFKVPIGNVHSVAFSADGQRIASGGSFVGIPELKIWDANTGAEILSLLGHKGPVFSVAFSPDGKRLVSCSSDNTVKIWDATMGLETLTLKGHAEDVQGVAFSHDGQHIASGSDDKTVKIWDADKGR